MNVMPPVFLQNSAALHMSIHTTYMYLHFMHIVHCIPEELNIKLLSFDFNDDDTFQLISEHLFM